MVVERGNSESGQSIIEFMLLLPLIVGMVVSLVKVNTAVQISIVNQQYTRAHALFMTYNSPNFPELKFRVGGDSSLGGTQANQMAILMGEEPYEESSSGTHPHAPTQSITKSKTVLTAAGPGFGQKAGNRSQVRLLSSVSICTQPNYIGLGNAVVPIQDLDRAASENIDFRYCAYPFIEGGGP